MGTMKLVSTAFVCFGFRLVFGTLQNKIGILKKIYFLVHFNEQMFSNSTKMAIEAAHTYAAEKFKANFSLKYIHSTEDILKVIDSSMENSTSDEGWLHFSNQLLRQLFFHLFFSLL